MYPATYKSICRVHDINEAIQFPFNGKEKQADLFLYLIDCYDVLLALYSNTEDIDMKNVLLNVLNYIEN